MQERVTIVQSAHLGACQNQTFRDVVIAFEDGVIQRRVAQRVARTDLRALRQQRLGIIEASALRRHHQRRDAQVVGDICIRPGVQQYLEILIAPEMDGIKQGRAPGIVVHIQFRSGRDQHLEYLGITSQGSGTDGREADAAQYVDIGMQLKTCFAK